MFMSDSSQSLPLPPFPIISNGDCKGFRMLLKGKTKTKPTDGRPRTRDVAGSALLQGMFVPCIQWLNSSIENIAHSDISALLYDQNAKQDGLSVLETARPAFDCFSGSNLSSEQWSASVPEKYRNTRREFRRGLLLKCKSWNKIEILLLENE